VRPSFTATLALAVWHAAAHGAPAGTTGASFSVKEYRVLGNSVLPVRDVERAVYPFLGENKQFADVEKARAALQAAYRAQDRGTVFVDIPEQDVTDGVVRLRVTEGRLHATTISGARYFSESKLLAALPEAAPGTVPRLGELQKEIAAVNGQSRDRSLVPVLKAGPEPGTIDLALKVQDSFPFHASAELNNQYTEGTKPLRAILAADYANMFGVGGDLAVQYLSSPQDRSEVSVWVAGYTSGPLYADMRNTVSYIHSASAVPAAGTLGVLGKGSVYSDRLTIPTAYSAASTQSVFFGADYKDFTQDIAVDSTTSLNTPISYINLSTGYQGAWRGATQQWSFSGSVNFGVRGLVNDPEAFANKRYLARANYFYTRDDGGLLQTLPGNFTLQLRLAGQWADQPLVNYEQYSIAGADGVRGYLESEQLGDNALKGTLQVNSPGLHLIGLTSQVFVFYDAGRMYVIDALPDTPSHALLKSVGGGLNLVGRYLTGAVTWAYPLVNSVATARGDSRVLFVVRGAF
jgi:hemolysin activation/secretion protein